MEEVIRNAYSKLVDIDWQFGVIAASSEDNLVGQAFVFLKFTLETGSKRERVHFELSVPQFYNLLHELEKAKTNLEC